MGSYRRGDPFWDNAHRRLQNTNGLRPLRSSPSVICYGHGHRSWHQDAIRLFGLLGGRCSILTGVLGARQIHVGQASEWITKFEREIRSRTTLTGKIACISSKETKLPRRQFL